MPAYNAASTIETSIKSVTSQTYQAWELIIVDDCSVDSTREIAEAMSTLDSRIRLCINETNCGVAYSRNHGISQARGQWIAFLYCDDIWHDTKLEKQLHFMETTGAAISYTATTYINKEGTPSGYVLQAAPQLTYSGLLKRNLMSCSSVMVRRDVMIPFPISDKDLHEDYACWLTILRKTGCAHGLDEPLLIYRLAPSSKSGNRLRSAKMTCNTYRHVGYSCFFSLLLTVRYSLHSIPKRVRIKRGF